MYATKISAVWGRGKNMAELYRNDFGLILSLFKTDGKKLKYNKQSIDDVEHIWSSFSVQRPFTFQMITN